MTRSCPTVMVWPSPTRLGGVRFCCVGPLLERAGRGAVLCDREWERTLAPQTEAERVAFTRFVETVEPRLSHAFYAAYGPEVGSEVTADSLAYAWEHWDKVADMRNPAGYLYRVGQSKARRYHRRRVLFPPVGPDRTPEIEPALPAALEDLTQAQREAVILVYALEWTEAEAAAVLGKTRSSIHTHLERGLAHLRKRLEVDRHV